jgi:uncharacterized membrane protein
MAVLITGLVIFFGIHLVPWVPALRGALVARLGERGYKGLFAPIALAGFLLIILGKGRAELVPLYEPPTWGRQVALPLVLLAFVVLPGAYIRGNIKRYTRHPMLWGVTLWALAHLLANGDRASVLLFGAFLAYSLADMVSANLRGARLSTARYPWTQDLKVVVVGVIAYVLFVVLHPYLFGVAVR